MTRAEFAALPSKPRYERGDRVLTWDRASRPVLPGQVLSDDPLRWAEFQVCIERTNPSRVAFLPRWRVRLAPEITA